MQEETKCDCCGKNVSKFYRIELCSDCLKGFEIHKKLVNLVHNP